MSKLKKIGTVVLAGLMSVSIVGCSDMSKIAKIDDTSVNAGVYINYMLSEYQNQMYQMYYSGITSDYLNQEVDGKKLGEYLKDYAYEQTVDLVAINNKFDELKLELSTEDNSDINSAVKNYMSSMGEEYLSEQGVSQDSVKQIITGSKKKELIFNYFYAKDGKEAVTNDEITNYLKDNEIRYKAIQIERTTEAATTAAGETETTTTSAEQATKASKEADQAASKMAEKYLKKAQENSDFDAVIAEYKKETEETTAATTAATTTAATTSAATDTSEATTTTPAVTSTTTTAVASQKDCAVKFFDANQEEYASDTPQKEQTVKTGEKASKPADPVKDFYKFEGWYTDTNFTEEYNFDSAITADTSIYANFSTNEVMADMKQEENSSNALYTQIKNKIKMNTPTIYKDDNYYYVIVKYDPTERTDYLIDGDNYENILYTMKNEDYEKKIDSWTKDYKIEKNEEAFEEYTPEKMVEIQTEYEEENSTAS